jgi:tRNA (guanine-N7-)-methyltransferase
VAQQSEAQAKAECLPDEPVASSTRALEARRRIRSYVLRQGRRTDALLPRWRLDPRALSTLGAVAPTQLPVLEIGFGNGEALVQCASTAPQRLHLGAEVHAPGVGHALLRIEATALGNVRIHHGDAVELLEQLDPHCLGEVRIWFPDPWHKSRHHKRRLVQSELIATLCTRLAPAGILHLATDWQPYAEHMRSVLAQERRLSNLAAPDDYAPRPLSRPKTHFEARGLKLGHTVFDLLYGLTS